MVGPSGCVSAVRRRRGQPAAGPQPLPGRGGRRGGAADLHGRAALWIVRGSFAEGAEWLDSFLGLDARAVPAAVRGAALVGRAQLALASDPAGAEAHAAEGLELCRAAGEVSWMSAALNLLAEASLHAGQADEAAARADRALAVARKAGDRWNEGYALGTTAAAAAQHGDLRDAQRLGEAALAIMRDIDQQWGAARTLLGLADLARLTR